VFRAARIGDTAVGHLQLHADQPGLGSRRHGCQTSTLLPAGWETSLRDHGVRCVIWSGLAAFQVRVLSDDERRPTEPAGHHPGDLTAEFCRAGDAYRDSAAHTIALPQLVQPLATETWPSSSLLVAKSSSGNLPLEV
jgi:hypothetical protein